MSDKKAWLYVSAAAVLILLAYTFWKRTPPGIYWEDNSRQTHAVSYGETLTRNANKQIRTAKKLRLKGRLNSRVLEKKKTVKVMFQFSGLSLSLDGANYPDLDRIYASPFIVEFARNGAVKKVHFPSDIAPDDEKDVAAIIRQLQFVIKKSITSAWHTRENDSAGSYEAEYLYDKISLKKRKTGYAEITDRDGHANGEITAAVRESRAEIFYGKPFTWLRRSSGRDKVTFFYSEDSYITSSVTFSAKKAKFRPGEKLAIWKEAGTFKKILADWRSKPKNRHSFADMLKLAELRKAYGTVSFNSVAEPMLLKNSGEETEKGIAGYLALFPEDSMKLAGLVASGRLTPGQNSTAINSLARAGHAEAQGALVRIINDATRAERVRILSAKAIATLAQPVPATIEGLWNAYHKRAPENQSGLNVAGNAVMTLGTLSGNMARSYREDLQSTAEDIREKIISELSNEGPMKPALISAAGETGHGDAIDAIEDELDSDNPGYRSAAIASIKDFEDPGVNGILIKRLRKEDNPGVRAALVEALAGRKADEGSASKLISIAVEEKSARTREKMYLYIIRNIDLAEARKKLPELLKTETSPANRKLLLNAIQGGKKR